MSAPSWSPVPADGRVSLPVADPGPDAATTDRYAPRERFDPVWLGSRLGVVTAAVLTVVGAAALLLFSPFVAGAVLELLRGMPAGVAVVHAASVTLPLVSALFALAPLRAVGIGSLPTLGSSTRPVELEAAVDERLRRALPASRAMAACGWIQVLAYIGAMAATVVTVVAQGRTHGIDPELGRGMTGWLCIEVALIMAVTSGRRQNVALVVAGLTTIAYQALVPAVDPVSRIQLMADPLLLGILVYGAQRFVIETTTIGRRMTLERRFRLRAGAALDAAVTEAGRIEDLVHDHILSCLLLTSRGGAEDEWASQAIKTHAATALDTLDEIADPAPAPALAPLSTEEFTRQLAEQVRVLDARLAITVRGRRRAPVPAEVAHTLTAAVLEAVRNSLRHAEGDLLRGEAPVRRSLSITLSEAGLSLEVDDNGVGFDPARLPPRSMGLRNSILRRVQQLPGGHAGVASAPMAGTAVQLSWMDDVEPAPEPEIEAGDTGTDAGFRLRESGMTTLIGIALGMLAATAVLTLPAFRSWWSPIGALVLLAAFAVILNRTWATPTGAPPSWMWPYLGLFPTVLAAIGVVSHTDLHPALDTTWIDTSVIILLVVLSLARYYAAAWIGAVAASVLSVVWNLATTEPVTLFAGPWPLYLVTVLFCTVMGTWSKGRIEEGAALRQERDANIARHVQQAEVLRQRQARSAELDVVVRPLVTRLAGDERVTPEVELEAGLLEARLRDDMRARSFHGTDVSRAAWDARARGVVVELLDDGGLTTASGALQDAVVAVVAAQLDDARDGQIIVRVLPVDRDVVATVLHQPRSGPQSRTEILEDGRARTVRS